MLILAIKPFSAYGQLRTRRALLGLSVLVFCLDIWHHGKGTSLRARGWVTLGLSLPLPGPGLPLQTRVGSRDGKGRSGRIGWGANSCLPACLMGWSSQAGENGSEGL